MTGFFSPAAASQDFIACGGLVWRRDDLTTNGMQLFCTFSSAERGGPLISTAWIKSALRSKEHVSAMSETRTATAEARKTQTFGHPTLVTCLACIVPEP
eukprot:scaffold74761_cov63-Phaeocystis_antarctica.AAC.1